MYPPGEDREDTTFANIQDRRAVGDQAQSMADHTVTPRLVVPDVHAALAFYTTCLGAARGPLHAEPSGHVVHSEIRIGQHTVSLTQARREWGLDAPETLGGSPVLLTLTVTDASAVGTVMTDGGATVIVPIEDRPYGKREGRIRDPFGHLWIISQTLPAPAKPRTPPSADTTPPHRLRN